MEVITRPNFLAISLRFFFRSKNETKIEQLVQNIKFVLITYFDEGWTVCEHTVTRTT